MQRRVLLRLYIILVPLSFIAYGISNYFIYYNIPESFEKGVELLKKNKNIQSEIGIYESYTYFNNDLPEKIDDPASFKVSLTGDFATIYLSCKIAKDEFGTWRLIEIKQDSLKKSLVLK